MTKHRSKTQASPVSKVEHTSLEIIYLITYKDVSFRREARLMLTERPLSIKNLGICIRKARRQLKHELVE